MRNGAGGCAAGGGMGWGLQPRNCSVLLGRGRRDSRDRQGCIAPSLARSSPGGARVGGELAWGGLPGGTGRELGCCGPSCARILIVASPFSIKAGGRPRSWQGECSSPFQQLQAALLLVTWGPGTRSGEGAAPLCGAVCGWNLSLLPIPFLLRPQPLCPAEGWSQLCPMATPSPGGAAARRAGCTFSPLLLWEGWIWLPNAPPCFSIPSCSARTRRPSWGTSTPWDTHGTGAPRAGPAPSATSSGVGLAPELSPPSRRS